MLQPTATANLGVTEKLVVNGGVTLTNGIVNPSIVIQDKTANVALRGDFATDGGAGVGLKVVTYTDTNFAAPVAASIESVAASTSLPANSAVYALKVGAGGNAVAPVTLTLGGTLTVGNNAGQAGVLLNGTTGTGGGPALITGGTLAFGAAEALLYAGSSLAAGGGTIASAITGSGGVTVFGTGILTLGGANTYTGFDQHQQRYDQRNDAGGRRGFHPARHHDGGENTGSILSLKVSTKRSGELTGPAHAARHAGHGGL